MEKNKITLFLLIIFIITTITLGGYIIYDKIISKTNDNQTINNDIPSENNNDIPSENNNDSSSENNDNIKENIENNINKELKEYVEKNYLLSLLKFTSPENLLKENKETNKTYLDLQIQYSEYALIQHQHEEYIGSFSISLDNIKQFLKNKFNHNYTDEEIKEYFKENYVDEYDTYMIPTSGGLIPPQIKDVNKENNEYEINVYISSDFIKSGTIIIKEYNNQFYFYSSTGLY